MEAFALVKGPRRKVLYVSDSCSVLWSLGAATFDRAQVAEESNPAKDRQICKQHDAYIVRIEFTLGDPITMPRRRKQQ